MEVNIMSSAGLWHERQRREIYAELKTHGVDSVSTSFYEDDFSRKTLKWVSGMMHEAGLKVYAMPGRTAGLFAAGPNPCSFFTIRNMDSLVVDENGKPIIDTSGFVACVNQPKFKEWFRPFIEDTIRESGVDGILFDEPKSVFTPCYCDICRGIAGNDTEALSKLRAESMAKMLGWVSDLVKNINSDFTTIVMSMPKIAAQYDGLFIDACCRQPSIDVIGVDGPICKQTRCKTSLFDSAPQVSNQVHDKGKKSMALIETFNVPESSLPELEQNIERIPRLGTDLYSFNYYGHENDKPDAVMNQIWRGISLLKEQAIL